MDRDELISCCQKEYAGNQVELDRLNRFKQDYSPEQAIWWYTCESFFYKTLNAALRKQNIHMMFLYRSFIADIYHQLKAYQSKDYIRVYRSQLMSIDEIDYLRQNVGQFVSVNSFLSTSSQLLIADFYMGDTIQKINLERVLFDIVADPNVVTTKPFANISSLSNFPDETEILFMVGSIFRINSITCNKQQVWIIEMSLCGDSENSLKAILEDLRARHGTGETNLCILGKLLWKMGKFDLAKSFYIRCESEVSRNDPILFTVYEDLADMAYQRNNHDESMIWWRKLEELRDQSAEKDKPTKGK